MQKEKKEDRDRLTEQIDKLNQEILAHSWRKDCKLRKYHDKNLTNKKKALANQKKQECNLLQIDISIAEQ